MQTDMITIIPTADEWRQALDVTRHRRSSRTLDIVKTVILVLVTAYCWIPFFWDGAKEWSSFIIGAAALLVAVAMWFIPSWSLHRDAQKIAARQVTVRLTLTDEGLGLGKDENYVCVPFDKVRATKIKSGVALEFAEHGSISVLPYRAFTVAQGLWLLDRLLPKEEV